MRPTFFQRHEWWLFPIAAVLWVGVVAVPLPLMLVLYGTGTWTAPEWAWWIAFLLWLGGGGINAVGGH